MGIVCSLFRAPDVTLTTLTANPEFFHDFERLDEKPFKYEVKPGLIGRLLGKKPRVVQLGHNELPFERITEDDRHYLDKAWHVLHYLMVGTANETDEVLGFFLSGGASIGEQVPGADVIPRVFLADQTVEIAAQVSGLAIETLASRFHWPEMMRQQVYPEIRIEEKFPQQLWDDYRERFIGLKEFLQTTTEAKRGMVVSYG